MEATGTGSLVWQASNSPPTCRRLTPFLETRALFTSQTSSLLLFYRDQLPMNVLFKVIEMFVKTSLPYFVAAMLLAIPLPSYAQDVASAKRQMIQQSIQRYSGNCPCPYNRASNGSRCGARSAWSRPGGASPLCYAEDVTDSRVRSWMARNNMQVTRPAQTNSDPNRATIKLAQSELNRLGCELGTPDGIIGPMSREALREFSAAAGIELNIANMRSQLFVRRLQNTAGTVCR